MDDRRVLAAMVRRYDRLAEHFQGSLTLACPHPPQLVSPPSTLIDAPVGTAHRGCIIGGMDRLRRLARRGRWPLGRLATAWLIRSRRHDKSFYLALVMLEARDPKARGLAADWFDERWAEGPEQREDAWRTLWNAVGNIRHQYPTGFPPEAVRFMLTPEPDSPHVPRVRLVAGLSIDAPTLWPHFSEDLPTQVVKLIHCDDPATRDQVADLLRGTDEPHLVRALEKAFVAGLHGGASAPLWTAYGRTDLLRIVLDNPSLPRDSAVGRAVLQVLRGRHDLLPQGDPDELVVSLRHLLRGGVPAPAAAAARSALRSFDAGPYREAVCRAAMPPVHDQEAIEAAVSAGYRPADPNLAPVFLVLTGQWDRLRAEDAGRLPASLANPEFDTSLLAPLIQVLDEQATPVDIRVTLEDALAVLGPGPACDALCALAVHGARARRLVITAGLVPSDPGRAVSFLVRTRQWERYDAVDPDGEILRAYAERLGAWNYERNELRAAAEEAGRPLPCEASTSPSSVSGYGSGTSGHGITPGGTGTMTGGFTGGFGGI